MLTSRRGYNWNNVLSPNWWACNWVGLQAGGLMIGILPYLVCVFFHALPFYLFVPTASISSMKTIEGACSSATLNISLTSLGPSPYED